MSVIIVEREWVHQKSEIDALTQRVVHDSASRCDDDVRVIPAESAALDTALYSREDPTTVVSFGREPAFLIGADRRWGASPAIRFLNHPSSGLFATRRRFLTAASALATAVVPRWIDVQAERAATASTTRALGFPLWIHHPVYNPRSSDDFGRRIDTIDDLRDVCGRLAGEHVLLQEDVKGTLQKVYFMNGRTVSDRDLTQEQEDTLSAIAGMSRSTFFGVDYLTDGTSAWIIEMNDWPSFRGYEHLLTRAIMEVLGA